MNKKKIKKAIVDNAYTWYDENNKRHTCYHKDGLWKSIDSFVSEMNKIEQEVIDCARRWAFHYGKSGGKHYDSAADKVRVQNGTIRDLLDAVSELNEKLREQDNNTQYKEE